MQLCLLHSPRLVRDDGSTLPLNDKDAALLAVLAVDGAATRERLIALLWPADPTEQARNRLRQRLFRLRRHSGADVVVAGELVALSPALSVDVHTLHDALAADARALRGELLDGLHFDDLLVFGEWLVQARERWRAQRRDALAALASRLEEAGRIAAALDVAQRLVDEEPLHEHGVRRLMRLHQRRGDRSAALAAYERLRERLDATLGETPSRETQELASDIEASVVLPALGPAPVPRFALGTPRLVGRELQWAALNAAWDARRIAVLRGEPGIGKSRLLGEFLSAREAALRVGARPDDASVPYALLVRLLRAVLASRPEAATAAPGEWALLLPELGRPSEAPLALLRLRHAVQALVDAAAPEAIAIDDLQFADAASLEVLAALVAPGRATRWWLALRAGDAAKTLAPWALQRDGQDWSAVDLDPLDVPALHAMLESLRIPDFDASGWARPLHRHTGGNPLFVMETLLAVLRDLPAGAAPANLPLPAHLHELIRQRLERLSPAALKLARVMALAGTTFGVDLGAAVLDAQAVDLADPWHELETMQVCREGVLAHDLIREAVLRSIPAPLARWMHARVADWLAQHDGAPAHVALHRRAAGEHLAAGEAALRAASAARAVSQRSEELDRLDDATRDFDAAGAHAQRFEAGLLAVIAAREVRSLDDARARAQSLRDAARDDREAGLAMREFAVCHLQGGNVREAAPLLEAAAALLDRVGAVDDANHSRYLHAMAGVHLHGPAAAVEQMEMLAEWARQLPDRDLGHAFGNDFAITLDLADQRRRAQAWFEASIEYFDRVRDAADACAARMMLGRSLLLLGEGARACSMLETALRERREMADGAGGQGFEALYLGRAHVELGRYGDALALLEPLQAQVNDSSAPSLRAGVALALARAWVHLAQPMRAEQALAGVPADASYYLQATAAWVRSMLCRDKPVERRHRLDEALGHFVSIDLASSRLPIAFDRLALDVDDDARTRFDALFDECVQREMPAVELLGRMRLVQWLLARSRADDACAEARTLRDALSRCTPIGVYPAELHWTCHQAARAAGDDTLAADCLRDALAWVDETTRSQVPPPFHDAFRHRHPVNRAILAAGGWL